MPRRLADYPPSPWMNKRETAHFLGVSVHTINQMIRDGRLTRHYIGGVQSVRISREEANALVQPADETVLRAPLPTPPHYQKP